MEIESRTYSNSLDSGQPVLCSPSDSLQKPRAEKMKSVKVIVCNRDAQFTNLPKRIILPFGSPGYWYSPSTIESPRVSLENLTNGPYLCLSNLKKREPCIQVNLNLSLRHRGQDRATPPDKNYNIDFGKTMMMMMIAMMMMVLNYLYRLGYIVRRVGHTATKSSMSAWLSVSASSALIFDSSSS